MSSSLHINDGSFSFLTFLVFSLTPELQMDTDILPTTMNKILIVKALWVSAPQIFLNAKTTLRENVASVSKVKDRRWCFATNSVHD